MTISQSCIDCIETSISLFILQTSLAEFVHFIVGSVKDQNAGSIFISIFNAN